MPTAAFAPAGCDSATEGFAACLKEKEAPEPDPALAAAMLRPPAAPLVAFTLRLGGTVYEISVARGDPAPLPDSGPAEATLTETRIMPEPEEASPSADAAPPAPPEGDFTDLPLRNTRQIPEQAPGGSGLVARLVVFQAAEEALPPTALPGFVAQMAGPPQPAAPVADHEPPPPPEPEAMTPETAASPPDSAAECGQTDSRMELTLAPEDLGPLHFSMETQGDVIRVLLSAEQPVSLELLRRHAAELVQNLHDAGYREARMSFGHWQQARASDTRAPPRIVATPPLPEPADSPPQPTRRAGRRGLDIKF
ncbi:flagellar hook-length control protein FliK [Gemmobacter aquatilis]|nr:flagellar hook-length control protein FliK [Gemmobacter aquatilis]